MFGDVSRTTVLLERLRNPPLSPLRPGWQILAGTGRAPGPVSVGQGFVVETAELPWAFLLLSFNAGAGSLAFPRPRPHPFSGTSLVTGGPGTPAAPPLDRVETSYWPRAVKIPRSDWLRSWC